MLLLFLYWHPAVGQRSKLASAFASVCACVCEDRNCDFYLLFFFDGFVVIFVESKTPPHVVPPSPAPAATNWKL